MELFIYLVGIICFTFFICPMLLIAYSAKLKLKSEVNQNCSECVCKGKKLP